MNYYQKLGYILWTISLFLFSFAYGQSNLPVPPKTPTKWGVVSEEEKAIDVYKLDPDAPAVILWDHGTWTPENWEKGKVRLFRHIRIKILKEEGLRYSKGEIRYRSDEKLGTFRAQTLNWDFGKNKAVATKVQTKPFDSLDGSEIVRNFEFPEVEVGSIIEYRYSLVATAFEELKPWYFQSELPTRWSEVQTRGFDPYVFKTVPIGPKISNGPRGVWRAKYISALPKEPYAGPSNQYRAGVRFFLTTLTGESKAERWKRLRELLQYNTYLDPEQKELNALYAISQDLIKDAITEEEKTAAIHDHVRKQVRWNGKHELWVKQDPAKVYKNRKGNGSEINMLLFYMLDMAGLKPEQVFVSTKSHGPPTQSPLFNQYNHLICRVEAGENVFYLDATEKWASFDLPPADVLNGASLLLKDTTTHLISLQPRVKSNSLWMIQAKFEANHIDLEVKESHSGYAGVKRRKLRAKEQSAIISSGDDFRPMNHPASPNPTYKYEQEPEFPLDIYYTLRLDSKDYIEKKGDTLLIDPLLCFASSMPFEAKSRKLQVDIEHPREFNLLLNIRPPAGYQLAFVPNPTKLSLSGKSLTFDLQANQIGELVSVQARFVMKRPLIYPEDYAALREFYQKMLAKEEERLIFVKR